MSRFDQIIGYEYVKELFERSCKMYENRESLIKMGIDLPKSILLYGKKHHGKTYMGNLFADEAEKIGFKTFRLDLEDEESYKVLTEAYKEDSVCILFDNITEENLPKSLLSDIVDIQEEKERFILLGISDDKEYYSDERWPYAGGFDMRLHIDDLSFSDTKAVFDSYIADKTTDGINADDIAAMLHHCKFYKMVLRVLNNAYINSLNQSKPLTPEYIVESFNYYSFDYDNKEGIFQTEEEKIETAIHEAGHAVIQTVLGDDVGYVTMLRKGHQNKGGEGTTYSFTDVFNSENEIVALLGGMAAVNIYLHKFASGTYSDLNKAIRYSRNLIIGEAYYGLDLLDMDIDSSEVILSDNQKHATHRLLEEKYAEAKEILINNKEMLDYITKELLTKGYVFRSEILKFSKTDEALEKKAHISNVINDAMSKNVVW